MSIPSFRSLLAGIGMTTKQFESTESVTVPSRFFKFLLQLNLDKASFDSERYLANNKDVVDAISRGSFDSAWSHFLQHGYFEGRPGAEPVVDEKWYTDFYSDIESAIRGSTMTSARQHFLESGELEFRFPNKATADLWQPWKAALMPTTQDSPVSAKHGDVDPISAPPKDQAPTKGSGDKKSSGYKLKRR